MKNRRAPKQILFLESEILDNLSMHEIIVLSLIEWGKFPIIEPKISTAI